MGSRARGSRKGPRSREIRCIRRPDSRKDNSMKNNAIGTSVRTRMSALAIMAMMFSMGQDLMAQTNTSITVKNIVLVHGGLVDGSGWKGVYQALKKEGYT